MKERLRTILQSENTIKFFNKLTNLSLSLGNSPQTTNAFIDNVFIGDGVGIINKNVRKGKVNDVTIDNKKILIRTNRYYDNASIKFKNINYDNGLTNLTKLKNRINDELNSFDYLLFIKVKDDYDDVTKCLKVCYHYYLFPFDKFKVETDFKLYNSRGSTCSYQWFFNSINDLYFKYNKKSLILYEICPPFVSL